MTLSIFMLRDHVLHYGFQNCLERNVFALFVWGKIAAKFADEVIVLSKTVQDYFQREYGRETVFIPNGVIKPELMDAKIIKSQYGLSGNDYILFLGRLVPEKGLRYLIEAFKQVKTDKKLVIAGDAFRYRFLCT